MNVFIDSDFHCHTSNPDNTFREVETTFFDGKCEAFIEGYIYIPSGESWGREDGVVFCGEMIAPWKNYSELNNVQRAYEIEKLADAEKALSIFMGGSL